MAHEKYLPGGGLNPFWIDEQEMAREKQETEKLLTRVFEACIRGEEQINRATINDQQKYNNDRNNNSLEDELEAKFQFLKKHSGSPEELKLAKEILGLK